MVAFVGEMTLVVGWDDLTLGEVIAGVVLTVAALVLCRMATHQRLRLLAKFAAEEGLAFRPNRVVNPGPPAVLGNNIKNYTRFHCLGSVSNLIPGLPIEHRFVFFEHVLPSHRSEMVTTYFRIDAGLYLGNFAVRRQSDADITLWGDSPDIGFDHHEFCERFFVRSPDRQTTYEVFHHGMIDFMLAQTVLPMRANANELFICTFGSASPEAYRSMRAFAEQFLAHLPRTIVNRERERRGLAPTMGAGSAARNAGV